MDAIDSARPGRPKIVKLAKSDPITPLFSAYNGKQTRSYIGDLIRETSSRPPELIQTMDRRVEAQQALLERMDQRLERQQAFLERMDGRLEAQQTLLERQQALLERMDQRLERQQALLERIADRQDGILTAVRQTRP